MYSNEKTIDWLDPVKPGHVYHFFTLSINSTTPEIFDKPKVTPAHNLYNPNKGNENILEIKFLQMIGLNENYCCPSKTS